MGKCIGEGGISHPRKSKTGEPISMKLEMGCNIRGRTTYTIFGHSAIYSSGGYPTVSFLF
jgi:hypothetical protein